MFPSGQQRFSATRRNIATGTLDNWKQSSLDRHCRCVCAACNNGWMSEIESRTKSILGNLIAGKSIEWNSRNQRRLAVWVCLRMYIFESASGSRYRPLSTSVDRLNFKLNNQRVPPSNTIVWLGFLPSELAGSAYYRIDTSVSREEDNGIGLQVLTGLVGKIAFQVFQWRGMVPVLRGGQRAKSTILIKGWESRLIEIWPKHYRARQPLPATMTVEGAVALCRRLKIPRE